MFCEEREIAMKKLNFDVDDFRRKIKDLALKISVDNAKINEFGEKLESLFSLLFVFSKMMY